MQEWLRVILFSLCSVGFLFIISKILGKKQIAQLEFIDYVMGISIGSIAAEMATDVSDNPFWYYLIAMAIFFLFDLTLTFLGRKGFFMKRFLKGAPLTIVKDGKIDYKQLKKSKLDVNELIALCREKGFFNLQDVAYVIFENSGEVSVLPKSEKTPTVVQDIDVKKPIASLTKYLIVDGRILKESLRELIKDKNWLFNQLKLKNEKELKNVILAFYDDNTKKVIANYKE